MLILATSISGSGKDKALHAFKEYAEARNKKVEIFHTGNRLFKLGENVGFHFTEENVLNADPSTSMFARSGVMENVCAEIPKLKGEDSVGIVTTHIKFYWDYRFDSGFDPYYLNRLKPDMYIYFLDNIDSIADSLKAREQWHDLLFGEDEPDGMGKRILLLWQSGEFVDTKMLALRDRKECFVVPSKADPSVLYKLIFEPWRKVFYIGMPLTFLHGDEYAEARERINNFIDWVNLYIVGIDPRFVEPLTVKHLSVIDRPVQHNVVTRDLYYLIPNALVPKRRGGMIAFFPQPGFSDGVGKELHEVYANQGKTFLIYPPGYISPFLVKYSQKIFRGEEQFQQYFLEWLGPEYLKKVEESEKGI